MRQLIIVLSLVSVVAVGVWMWTGQDAGVRIPIGKMPHVPVRATQLEAEIAIGRVETMQDQTGAGLRLLGVRVAESGPAVAEKPIQRVYRTVERYNALHALACARRVVGPVLCKTSLYKPRWYEQFHFWSGTKDPSEDYLAWAQEVQATMTPLWEAVCARASAESGDQHVCAIE